MTSKVTVQVVSDTVCPFCMLGKKRLETAIRAVQGQKEVEVHWHPFQLNPNAPKEGINKLGYYKAKFGPERTAQMIPRMTDAFAAEGLQYSMEGLTGNTFNSHRLIAHAAQQGTDVQNRLVDELFKAYFTQGKYINDPEVLKEAARAAGVTDGERVVEDESIAADQVREELHELATGVQGVPFFIFNGKTAVSGAQDPAVFKQALLAS